jgi:hypothetical protein
MSVFSIESLIFCYQFKIPHLMSLLKNEMMNLINVVNVVKIKNLIFHFFMKIRLKYLT